MALSEKLQTLFDSIKAMPMSVAKDVDIPIRPFIQIAGRIIAAGERDTAELQRCKYDTTKIPDMRLYLELLQEISAHYDDIQFDQPETYKEFVIAKENAEEILSEMLAAIEYAANGDENLLAKISKIREGNSYADLIQDLVDTKVICESNITLLQNIGFDESILETAKTLSLQLTDLLAKATLDRSDSPEKRIERDKVYTILKVMVKDLSRAGSYAFINNPTHAERYSMSYTSRKRKKKDEQKSTVAA